MAQTENIQKTARLTAAVAGTGQDLSLCPVRSHVSGKAEEALSRGVYPLRWAQSQLLPPRASALPVFSTAPLVLCSLFHHFTNSRLSL